MSAAFWYRFIAKKWAIFIKISVAASLYWKVAAAGPSLRHRCGGGFQARPKNNPLPNPGVRVTTHHSPGLFEKNLLHQAEIPSSPPAHFPPESLTAGIVGKQK
jgi:hypothetical protein